MAHERTELTGNDYVSIPSISPSCALDGVNVLHSGLGGLVEWMGDGDAAPLLQPELVIDDVAIPIDSPSWRRVDRWIPEFRLALPDGSTVHGTVCAPTGMPAARGFLIRIDLDNRSRTERAVRLRLRVTWRWTRLWVATGRPLPGPNRLFDGGQTLCLESDGGRGPTLAITGTHALSTRAWLADAEPESLDGRTLEAAGGELLRATVEQSFMAAPQRRTAACFFVGAGRERDGAQAAAHALRRLGPDEWLRRTRLELSHILRAGGNPETADLLNRNLLFNRFFAVGRTIDDDRLRLLRSRSTRCPAPALFNEREALFWTMPALIMADPGIAREAIFRVYDDFSERSGEYLRYLDGGAFDADFALDQLLLYAWIADYYIAATGDESLLDEPLLRQVIAESDAALFLRLHPQHMLCGTDLLPSGDRADHPFTTFGNALVRWFADALPRLWTKVPDEPPLRFEGAAAEVGAAIWQHCTTTIDGVSILASSASLEGDAAVYDDPAGSLALLPFFGFCAADDPVWRDTMEFLRSTRYPLWRHGAVPGLATRSDTRHARVSALCADLLGPDRIPTMKRLVGLRTPAGVAAAAFDPASGEAIEPHHAALAGFVAWTVAREADRGTRNRRKS